jgi:hypothetical protein
MYKVDIINNDIAKSIQTHIVNYHMPCVRQYYNMNEIHICHSAIISHLLQMNFDMRSLFYFGPSVIQKYEKRGYPFIANDYQKEVITEYNEHIKQGGQNNTFKFKVKDKDKDNNKIEPIQNKRNIFEIFYDKIVNFLKN